MSNSWKHNPYYYPQERGLEIVAYIDFAGSYEFDMVVVWRKLDDNTLVWASDSGCSCPTPFKGYTDIASLEPLSNWDYFESTVHSMSRGQDKNAEGFLREVRSILLVNGG